MSHVVLSPFNEAIVSVRKPNQNGQDETCACIYVRNHQKECNYQFITNIIVIKQFKRLKKRKSSINHCWVFSL